MNSAGRQPGSTRGWAGRAAAGRATRWSSTSRASTTRRGSIAPAISTARRCTSSSATRRIEPDIAAVRGDDRGSEGVHAALEDEHAALSPVEKNAQLLEYKCVEFVEELMYGHLRKGASR